MPGSYSMSGEMSDSRLEAVKDRAAALPDPATAATSGLLGRLGRLGRGENGRTWMTMPGDSAALISRPGRAAWDQPAWISRSSRDQPV